MLLDWAWGFFGYNTWSFFEIWIIECYPCKESSLSYHIIIIIVHSHLMYEMSNSCDITLADTFPSLSMTIQSKETLNESNLLSGED